MMGGIVCFPGKYREQIAACLRELYGRLYTSLADYSRMIGRDLVLEVFQEAITRSPVLDDAEDDKSPRYAMSGNRRFGYSKH